MSASTLQEQASNLGNSLGNIISVMGGSSWSVCKFYIGRLQTAFTDINALVEVTMCGHTRCKGLHVGVAIRPPKAPGVSVGGSGEISDMGQVLAIDLCRLSHARVCPHSVQVVPDAPASGEGGAHGDDEHPAPNAEAADGASATSSATPPATTTELCGKILAINEKLKNLKVETDGFAEEVASICFATDRVSSRLRSRVGDAGIVDIGLPLSLVEIKRGCGLYM